MKTLVFVIAVTVVAAIVRVAIFGWPDSVYFDDRISESGIEYTCMFASKEEFTIITAEENHRE